MALIKCPECGKEISDRAESCPNCGCPASEWESRTHNEDKKEDTEGGIRKEKEKYWCRKCYRQNEIGVNYCVYCGNRLAPYYSLEKSILNQDKKDNSTQTEEKKTKNQKQNKEFQGVYRSTLFGKLQEVYCPRCGSENCSHYQDQKVIPGKAKTRYTANLNPLHPFTLVNKKEKVKRKEQVVTERKFICNSCGKIFY